MDMNIRNVPEELINKIRHHATRRRLTIRDYVLIRLARIVGYKGTIHVTGVTYCPSCGRRKLTETQGSTRK